MSRTSREIIEFGDFQTPKNLAENICQLLLERGIQPNSIVEPTCGVGNLLISALDAFPFTQQNLGLEVCSQYITSLLSSLQHRGVKHRARIIHDSFFTVDWPGLLREMPTPILVIGNPPWVTNAKLGTLGSTNLPEKSNFKEHAGLDAITGKSNFDISEWMLINLLKWLNGRHATVAMLCKTAVARKVLHHAWKNHFQIQSAELRLINALEHFGASVSACLLICELSPSATCTECNITHNLSNTHTFDRTIGYHDSDLIANTMLFDRWKHLRGTKEARWRSGIKHDCSKVMELKRVGDTFINGLGTSVSIEEDFVFPMLKSSDIANDSYNVPRLWMLVPQKSIADDTHKIKASAPKTWAYLQDHQQLLGNRASSIYRNRPPFSIFGVGDYSFAPWKIAISGLYKKLEFRKIGPHCGKPVVLDDTSNFIPCWNEDEADTLNTMLNSVPAREFLESFIFWDAKRPVTIDILSRLNLDALAQELNFVQDAHSARGAISPEPRQKRNAALPQEANPGQQAFW